MSMPVKPVPPSEYVNIWNNAALRVRILDGTWGADLDNELAQLYNNRKASMLSKAKNLSKNPFKNIIKQIAILYNQEPSITAEGKEFEWLPDYYWQIAQALNRRVQGCREALIKVTVEPGSVDAEGLGRDYYLVFDLLTPDWVMVSEDPGYPGKLNKVTELRCREVPSEKRKTYGDYVYTWEVWDLKADTRTVHLCDKERTDVTSWYFKDSAIPLRDNAGKPIMPYIMYHAEVTGSTWNTTENSELVAGTLRLAAQWSGVDHGIVDAAYPQRYGVNVRLQGGTIEGKGIDRRQVVETDPTSILMFETLEGASGSLGQFEPALDVAATADVLGKLENDLAVYAGLNPGDLVATGDAKSGYSITVSRAGLRATQHSQEIAYRGSDQLLCATVARLLNSYNGTQYPEQPQAYKVTYKGIPLTKDEIESTVTKIQAQIDLGIANKVDAMLAFNPELSREDALLMLIRIEAENKQIAQAQKVTTQTEPNITPPQIPLDTQTEPDSPVA
jgi:hypothetical protein